MVEVGIRELKQNASAVVAQAAAGADITITERGRPVVHMSRIPLSTIDRLIDAGLARPARRTMAELVEPEPGPSLSESLREMRDDERF